MSKATTPTVDINPTQSAGDVIPSVAIDRIIAQRDSGIATFMQGMNLIHQAQTQLADASGKAWFSGLTEIVTCISSSYTSGEEAKIQRRISRLTDRAVWQRLMNETGMLTLMSTKQREAWDKSLYSDDCPEISLDNVLATFKNLNANKANTFEQGVIDVFRTLSWDYKTNNPCCLGKKIILNGIIEVNGGKYCSFRTYGQERINDLARPFWLLDGKNVPDYRVSEGVNFRDFIGRGTQQIGELFACDYFTIRAFKKGTAHITFTRPELVDKINDIVARHYPGALPPSV